MASSRKELATIGSSIRKLAAARLENKTTQSADIEGKKRC